MKKKRIGKIVGILFGIIVAAVLVFALVILVNINRMVKTIETETVVDAQMQVDTYGDKENPSLLMLHGMYMDGSNLKDLVGELSDSYYVIVPTMKGCEGSTELVFDSLEDECKDIEAYVNENLDGHLEYAYGLSMGATIIYNILQRDQIKVDKAILDGLYTVHQGKAMAYMMVTMSEMGAKSADRKQVTEPSALMKFSMKKGMGIPAEDVLEISQKSSAKHKITHENMARMAYYNFIYEIDPSKKITHTKVYLWCGDGEINAIASNKMVKPQITDWEEKLYENCGHTQMALQYYESYAKDIKEVLCEE